MAIEIHNLIDNTRVIVDRKLKRRKRRRNYRFPYKFLLGEFRLIDS